MATKIKGTGIATGAIDSTQLADLSGNIKLGDSVKALFGTGNDLQIYHNGGNSFIDDVGTGNLFIRSNLVQIRKYTGEDMITALEDGAVTLYHNGSAKLATNSGGVTVTGTAILGGASFVDNATAYFGTGLDLRLYHDGGNSYIKNNTGWLNMPLGGNGLTMANSDFTKIIAKFLVNGANELYYNGGKKLETTNTGGSFSGTWTGNTSTQSSGHSTTAFASTAFVQQEITSLIGGAPGALDTLNELAAAINDDANYNTTLTTALATKAPLATPQFTNRVGIGVAAHGTAALNITSTAQHMRLNNGSELGVISLESNGALKLWSHGDSNNELQFYQGSGSGYEVAKFTADGWFNSSANVATDNPPDSAGLFLGWNHSNGAGESHIVFNKGAGSTGGLRFSDNSVNGSLSELMRLENTGALGIGKIPPPGTHTSWSQLFVGEKGSLISEKANSGGLYGTWVTDNMYVKQSTGSFANITTDESSAYRQEAGVHQWFTQASGSADAAITLAEVMLIDSSGRVGIGITNPTEKFTVVNSSSGIVGRFTNNTNQTLDLGVISGSGAGGGVYYNNANSGYHAFQTGGTERMRIDSTGNVGIAKTSLTTWSSGYNALQVGGRGFVGAHSGSDLYVGQNASFNSGWKYQAAVAASMTQHSGGQITQFIAAAGSAGAAITWTPALHIKTNGNIGINTTSPAAKLSILDENAGQPMLQVRNYSTAATGSFGNAHSVELRSASSTTTHGVLIHHHENNIGRRSLEVADSNGVFATFVQGKVGFGTASPVTTLSLGPSNTGITFLGSNTGFNSGKHAGIRGEETGTGHGNLAFDTFQGGSGGGERMVILANGNVGIGTGGPDSKLEVVVDSTAIDYTLRLKNTNTTDDNGTAVLFQGKDTSGNDVSYGALKFKYTNHVTEKSQFELWHMNNSGVPKQALTLDHDGNFGLGTTDPTHTLHVNSSGGANVLVSRTGSAGGLYIESDGTNGVIRNPANSPLLFQTNNANTRMTILGDGKVGIGVTDPDCKLEIKGAGGGTGLTFKTTDASSNEVFYVQDGGRAGLNYWPLTVGIPSGTAAASGAKFQVEEAGLLTVLTNGNVGIGLVAPEANLDVRGTLLSHSNGITDHSGSASSTAYAINNKSRVSGKLNLPFQIYFPNGTANLAVRLYTTLSSLWFSGEVIIGSTYSNASATGFNRYSFSHNMNAGTNYAHALTQKETMGAVASHFTFDSHGYDATEGAHYFEFRHITSTGNTMFVQFQGHGSAPAYSTSAWYIKHTTF